MKDSAPIVSVIIPNYNHEKYLTDRISSVIGQTLKDVEIILMDDCSTDNSRAIIQKFAAQDARIRVVFNEQNSGSTFKQWNKGIRLCTGQYVWIAESDDVADPTLLEKLVGALEAYPKAGLAYCQSRYINHAGEYLPGLVERDVSQGEQVICLSGRELVERYMPITNIIPNASAVVMRRAMLGQVEPAPETMRLAGDWLFWVRCLLHADACFVAEPLNEFRTHQQNVRTATLRQGLNLREIGAVLGYIKQMVVLTEPVYQEALNTLIERWFHTFIYSDLSKEGHTAFMQVMAAIEPDFSRIFYRQLGRLLVRNRFSGLKMLIGDKLPTILAIHKRSRPG